MANLRQLTQEVLADGRIDGQEIERLYRELYADGKIDRAEADFLVELHKRVQRPVSPAWEKFFYQAIKDHVLADGSIDVEETAWLRRMLLEDDRIDDAERKFLHQVKGEARNMCHEFEALYTECMKEPPPAHTSGGGRSS